MGTAGPGMQVSIVYRKGCPNVEAARAHVDDALAALDKADTPVELLEVETDQEAQRHAMHGSPTVLVNGADPFAPPDAPTTLECRPYGAPTVEELIEVLA